MVVLGAGPARLATVVVEPEATGGQAGTSAMIRNYRPRRHRHRAGYRAFHQALGLGADIVYGQRAVVFYGAAATEAQAMRGEQVFVVGGGNSAGQAAVHLARYAAQVTVLVRGSTLAETMSDYLVRELEATPNIAVHYRTEAVAGHGEGSLTGLTVKDRSSAATETVPAAAVFVLIGAEPHTGWLPPAIRRDRWGFVVTGTDLLGGDGRPSAEWPLERPPMLLETSLPRVFAAGDVRHGSIKRVASAVGEGSAAIRAIHQYLSYE